jgi:hypothetical protein
MLKRLAIATTLLVASPAAAETVIIDITLNPLNGPYSNFLVDLAGMYEPDTVDLIVSFGPGIVPTDPHSYLFFINSVTFIPSVPEPATWGLMLLGLLGLIRLRGYGHRAR